MKRKERWFSSIVLIVCVLPLIVVAFVQSFVESPFIFMDIATKEYYELDVYQINFVGLFCVVPFIILVIARTLRGRGLIADNFMVIVIATLVLSCVYVLVMMWIVYLTVSKMDVTVVFTKMDYISMVCTLWCIIFCVLSNFLPDLKPNPFFGVKNKRTMANSEIWTKVNGAAASALTYIFIVDAVFTAYASGIFAIFFLLGGIFLYYIWVPLFSRYAFNRFVKENPDVNLGFSDN